MRIIGGELGGRVLRPPMKGWPTRPTTDIAREALYNILANRIDFDKIKMLDLFGGTGAHTIECISRGCRDATYVEKYGKCIRWMKQITQELEVSNAIKIINRDIRSFLKDHQGKYDFIFADPPYQLPWLADIPQLVLNNDLIVENGIFVLEHDTQYNFKGAERFLEERKYGQSVFSFFQ